MALNTLKCNHLRSLGLKRLKAARAEASETAKPVIAFGLSVCVCPHNNWKTADQKFWCSREVIWWPLTFDLDNYFDNCLVGYIAGGTRKDIALSLSFIA